MLLKDFYIDVKKSFDLNKKYIYKYGIILLVIYIFATISIIRADFNYIDDMGRCLEGYQGWSNFSRFTSENISKYLYTSSYLFDLSPLPQYMAVVFLVLASLIVVKILADDANKSITILASLSLGLSPYFLECLSYKYDSIYMALSIFISIFPLIFRKKNYLLYYIISVLSMLIMCTTYQASSGIFPMIVILIFYKMWINNDKESYKFALISMLAYMTGLIIFKFFIMIPATTYVSNEMFELRNIIPGFISNYLKYVQHILNDFKDKWLILIAIIYISFTIIMVKKSKKNKILTFFSSCIILVVLNLLCFGMYPILKTPLYDCRAMYGFGVLIALLSIIAVDYNKMYITKLAVIALGYVFVVFCLNYGNALAQQKRYTDFRVEMVLSDLKDMEIMKNQNVKDIIIKGNIGKSPEIVNYCYCMNKNLMNRLVPDTFCENWWWGYYYFGNYFGLKFLNLTYEEMNSDNLILFTNNIYHNIYYNENYILIELK